MEEDEELCACCLCWGAVLQGLFCYSSFWQVLTNSFVINRAFAVHHREVISWRNLLRKPFLICCSKFSQAFETLHFFIVSLPEIF